jgi:hypothetical protein
VAALTSRNPSSLVEIPAIHELLNHENARGEIFSDTTVDICRWILQRGRMVLNSLIKGPESPRMSEDVMEKAWMEVGATTLAASVPDLLNPRLAAVMACRKTESGLAIQR